VGVTLRHVAMAAKHMQRAQEAMLDVHR